RVGQVVQHVDLLPTLLELTGVPAPDGLPGRSLVPELSGASDPGAADTVALAQRRSFPPRPPRPPRPLPARPSLDDLVQHAIRSNFEPGEAYAIQDARHKLLWNTQLGVELYDLVADPYETNDLSEKRPELAKALLERLQGQLDTLRASALEGPVGSVDEASRRALEALGYIDR
ncbi:MAG: hypothetical protein ACQGVC_23945, partial [Myxococcota bacterium]